MEPGAELITSGLYETVSGQHVYITGTGQVLRRTHSYEERCAEGCVVHNPSDHSMRHMKTHWRSDRRMMERICEHGIGHPDPDHMKYAKSVMAPDQYEAEGVHGCDGCCTASTNVV